MTILNFCRTWLLAVFFLCVSLISSSVHAEYIANPAYPSLTTGGSSQGGSQAIEMRCDINGNTGTFYVEYVYAQSFKPGTLSLYLDEGGVPKKPVESKIITSNQVTIALDHPFTHTSGTRTYYATYVYDDTNYIIWTGKLQVTYNGGTTDPDPADLTLNRNNFSVQSDSSTLSLSITNDGDETLDWSVSNPPDWVTFSRTTGSVTGGSSSNIQMTVAQNSGTSSRSCSIKFKNQNNSSDYEDVTINQEGSQVVSKPANLELQNTNLSASADGEELSTQVQNNGDEVLSWSAQNIPTELQVIPDKGSVSGNSSTEVKIDVPKNTNTDPQNYTVKFVNNGDSDDFVDLKITQSGQAELVVEETISKPGKPEGEENPAVGVKFPYKLTSGAVGSLGHSLEYRFNWGDGDYSSWAADLHAHAKSWQETTQRNVTIEVRCKEHIEIKAESDALVVIPGLDTDGDGLIDSWEENGLDVDRDGIVDVALPAMGANKLHKDIFIEADYISEKKPDLKALQKVIKAFSKAPVSNPDGTLGIHLHIDAGPDSIMDDGTKTKWDTLSKSDEISSDYYDDYIGEWKGNETSGKLDENSTYNWDEFDLIKEKYFLMARKKVFHYCLFINKIGNPSVMGLSRSGESDFTVAVDPEFAESSYPVVFMHELGHNLGLLHGGNTRDNYKPNYLSIMNYYFNTRGLKKTDGTDLFLDYSRFSESDIGVLNENKLNEQIGITTTGTVSPDQYLTKYVCASYERKTDIPFNTSVDWNCNGTIDSEDIATNINSTDPDKTRVVNSVNSDLRLLKSYNDWEGLVYSYGSIGGLAVDELTPQETFMEEEIITAGFK